MLISLRMLVHHLPQASAAALSAAAAAFENAGRGAPTAAAAKGPASPGLGPRGGGGGLGGGGASATGGLGGGLHGGLSSARAPRYLRQLDAYAMQRLTGIENGTGCACALPAHALKPVRSAHA